MCACHSLINNKITLIKGKAGTGKSTLALSFLFDALEHDKIDRIIIFCNPVASASAARLGFYSGDRTTKLLDSQTGTFLASKLGGMEIIESLIQKRKLFLYPFSDLRGFDSSGMRAGIYIPEAQNLNISLMKLGLQRIGEDSVCVIDGDENAQVDLPQYEGKNNGMKRVSQVFRGSPIYGEITLKNIYRS